MTYATLRAAEILTEELDGRRLPLELLPEAVASAPRLLRYRRAQWPPARDRWESLVQGAALTVRRLEGAFGLMTQAEALRILGSVAAEWARRHRGARVA